VSKRQSAERQLDFFIADPSVIHAKEIQELMSRCWFSLSKKPRALAIEHYVGESSAKIEPIRKDIPLATIWDHDILVFLISQLVDRVNKGLVDSSRPVGYSIQFSGYEYFSFLRKRWRKGKQGAGNYELLWKGLERLHHTHITTDIKVGKHRTTTKFYWLPMIQQLRDEVSGLHYGYVAELPGWICDQVVERAQTSDNLVNVLSIDPGFFELSGGLEKWIYLWAKKSVSKTYGVWDESFNSLYIKSGSAGSERSFRHYLRKLIRRNAMVGYELVEMVGKSGPRLEVSRRTGVDLLMSPRELLKVSDKDSVLH